MTQSLFVRMDRIKRDPALQMGNRGARKLAVTRVYDQAEKPAQATCWSPPAAGQVSPVLQLPDTEMAVFNQNADQQRHYHNQATEIYVVVEGSMALEVNGSNHLMQAGDTFIVGPRIVHEVKNQGLKFTSYVISANCGGPGDKIPA